LKIIDTETPSKHFPSALGPFSSVLARIRSRLAAGLGLAFVVRLRLSPIAAGGLWPAKLCLETFKGPLEVSHLYGKVLFEALQTTQIPEALVILLAKAIGIRSMDHGLCAAPILMLRDH